MFHGDFDDYSFKRVVIKGLDERHNVGNVVGDVVAHHDIGSFDLVGDIWPIPKDFGVRQATLLSLARIQVEH